MPGEDGFSVCRRIRAQTEAPILFLTARTDEPSVLTGLGIGADDYLVKPFRLAELRARVNAHLRRQNRAPQHRLVRGGICFDLAAKSAAVGCTALPFTKSEYAICEFLALHAGQTFGKEQIYEAVFGYDGTADDTAITQHIKKHPRQAARRWLASPETVLKTVWGVGYLWNAADALTSLRSVLLRYLCLCGGGCVLLLMIWWGIFMQLIDNGFLLSATASAQACAEARETVASMTADTFDPSSISSLCRYAVVSVMPTQMQSA